MKENNETLLVSMFYENVYNKLLSSYFNFWLLPFNLIAIIGIIISFFRYENLEQLSHSFALGSGMLILSLVNLFGIIIYIFLMKIILKKFSRLDLTDKSVIINDVDIYPISDVKYQHIFNFSMMSRTFMLVDKETNKIIGHFVYRFSDVIFFDNSPEIIEQILETSSSQSMGILQQNIIKNKKEVKNIKKYFSKARSLTIISFFILVFLIASMILFRDIVVSKNNFYNQIHKSPNIINIDDIFKEYNKT